MNKPIAWLAAAQIAAIVVGFCTLGIVLKFCGYPEETGGIRFTSTAVALRTHGHWLLLISVLWLVYAIVCEAMERGLFQPAWATTLGLIIPVVMLALFLYAACVPFVRPLLWSTPSTASSTTDW